VLLRYTSGLQEYVNKALGGNFNATGDLTVNCEVPFDILLAFLDKRQGSRLPKETLFSELAVKIRQHFLNLSNSRAKLY